MTLIPDLNLDVLGMQYIQIHTNKCLANAKRPCDDYFVLSQYTHLTDEDEQNCDSNTVHCITCSRTVKIKFIGQGIQKVQPHSTYTYIHTYTLPQMQLMVTNCF